MSIENPNNFVFKFFKTVLLMQRMLLWLPMKILNMFRRAQGNSARKKSKIPNYMKITPHLGSERVLTECVRNDTMLTIRFYTPNTDMESIINFRKGSDKIDDMTLPLEMTMATHVDGELQYVHFSGIAVPIAKWDEKEFDKVSELSKNGPGLECPGVQVSVRTVSSEEADRLLGRRNDTIDPGSKVIN